MAHVGILTPRAPDALGTLSYSRLRRRVASPSSALPLFLKVLPDRVVAKRFNVRRPIVALLAGLGYVLHDAGATTMVIAGAYALLSTFDNLTRGNIIEQERRRLNVLVPLFWWEAENKAFDRFSSHNMAANICPLYAVASDSSWITWQRRIERTALNPVKRMHRRCYHMLKSPRRQLVVFALLILNSEVLPLKAWAGSAEDEGSLSGALKSLFDPNEKTQSGKVLPKAYLKSAREVVKTLRESLHEDTRDMAKFRRTADAAKESIRGYLNGWKGQSIVSSEESYVMIEKAIRSLANFYSKAGPSAPLPEDVKAEILSNLSTAEQFL